MSSASEGSGTVQESNGGSSYRKAPRKEYDVAEPKPKAFMVEDAQWDRIHNRVQALEAQGGIDWLMAGATMLAGIGASAGLALLALPEATTTEAELAPSVKPILWAVLISGLLLGAVMGLVWRHLRSDKTNVAADICNEMDTIQEAWQERESSDGS